MTKEVRIYNGEETAFSITILGKLGSYMQKNQTRPLSHTMYKNKLKRNKDLNVTLEPKKYLGKKHSQYIINIGLSNIFFLDMCPQARKTKAKINK